MTTPATDPAQVPHPAPVDPPKPVNPEPVHPLEDPEKGRVPMPAPGKSDHPGQ